MIKVEKHYKATALFNDDKNTTWDSFRNKSFKVSIFGLTIFKRTENLDIDYMNIETKKVGFKKHE